MCTTAQKSLDEECRAVARLQDQHLDAHLLQDVAKSESRKDYITVARFLRCCSAFVAALVQPAWCNLPLLSATSLRTVLDLTYALRQSYHRHMK